MFVSFGKPYCKVGDTCPLSFFNHNAAGATVSMLQAAKKDYIVYRPVAKHAVSSSQLRMCTRHPDLVSFAIPIFYIII